MIEVSEFRVRRVSAGVGVLLAGAALFGCEVEKAPVPQIQPTASTSETPKPTSTNNEKEEPEIIQAALPRDKRCYDLGKVACIELEKTPSIKGTLFAMNNGEVQFKVPVRTGSTNHTDGNVGIYTPRCKTTIQRKETVIYSTLLEETVGPIPMYDALSIACTDEIHDQGYHGGVFIHGSLDFDAYGYSATGFNGKPRGSHGCVNVNYANGNSQKVYNFFEIGNKAVIYDKTTMQIGYKEKIVKN